MTVPEREPTELPAAQQLVFAFDAAPEGALSGEGLPVRLLLSRPAATPAFSSQTAHPTPDHPTNTEFVRHPRARRYVLRVVDERTIRVTLPRWGSRRGAVAFVERERAWIEKQRRRIVAERARQIESSVPPAIGVETAPPSIGVRTAADPKAVSRRALVEHARRVLPARLIELARRHGLTVTRVSIRNQRWRWGSCSGNGHICLNWRLATMPDWVRDYVLIHELMHLKRMDHSKRFWNLVAAACPDYDSARRYLREHSILLTS